MPKFTIRQVLFFFLLNIYRSGRLAEIRWPVCISKSQRNLCISFYRTDSRLCIYYLFEWSNLNFLHNSQWITFPTQSCLVLYSLCANLNHSLIMWLIVSSFSPHNSYYYFTPCRFFKHRHQHCTTLWPKSLSYNFHSIKEPFNYKIGLSLHNLLLVFYGILVSILLSC